MSLPPIKLSGLPKLGKTPKQPVATLLRKLEAHKGGNTNVKAPYDLPPTSRVAPKPLKLTPKPLPLPSLRKSLGEVVAKVETQTKVSGFSSPPLATSAPPTTKSTKATRAEYVANPQQQQAIDYAAAGKSFVLTGAAGSGKTATVHEILEMLHESGKLTVVEDLRDASSNSAATTEGYNIAICGYTNRSVDNMASTFQARKPELYKEFMPNFLTVHKLCRVAPTEVISPRTGEPSMRMLPKHDCHNLLPVDIIILEEASNCSLDLWQWVVDAMNSNTQVIFLGDINQLPPVYGSSVLIEAMTQLPIVELTHIYRQALESPIIAGAHATRFGNLADYSKAAEKDGLDWIGRNLPLVGAAKFAVGVVGLVKSLHKSGGFNPTTDMILSPFNKHSAGTVALNLQVAAYMDTLEPEPPIMYEIKSGLETLYRRVGDRVFVDKYKMEGEILAITPNALFTGKPPQKPSPTLDRHGLDLEACDWGTDMDTYGALSAIVLQAPMGIEDGKDDVDVFRQSSHELEVRLESGEVVVLFSSGDVNGTHLGYCLTTHKAQGCQWDKVMVIAHQSHSVSLNREWLYTAGTRAETHSYLVASEAVLAKAFTKQRCKGITLEAKVASYVAKPKGMKNGINQAYVKAVLVK